MRVLGINKVFDFTGMHSVMNHFIDVPVPFDVGILKPIYLAVSICLGMNHTRQKNSQKPLATDNSLVDR